MNVWHVRVSYYLKPDPLVQGQLRLPGATALLTTHYLHLLLRRDRSDVWLSFRLDPRGDGVRGASAVGQELQSHSNHTAITRSQRCGTGVAIT